MIQLSEDQKLQVLLAELQERYNASHKIRARSIQFTLWISGMAIGLGWLLISQKPLIFFQRAALTLLITALFIGTVYFIIGLRRGFRKNRQAMIRCERALGMHEPGAFLCDKSLLPAEYSKTKRKWSDHFTALCVWLVLVAMALFILTWSCPDPTKYLSSKINIEKVKRVRKNG